MNGVPNSSLTVINQEKSLLGIFIESIPKLIWASLFCIALYMYHSQLSSILIRLSGREGASMEVAGIKITIPKISVPIASNTVKVILPKLDDDVIQYLVGSAPSGAPISYCWREKEPSDLKDNSLISKMQKLGLAALQKGVTDAPDNTCIIVAKLYLLPPYYETRSYLLSILTNLKFDNKSD